MKKTPFTDFHIANGARMADFGGYNMPIEFTGINDEHMTVRNAVGVFDVSHMSAIWVKGEKALPLLQRVTTNDVAALKDGGIQYTAFPNGRGGIIDDVLLYRFDPLTYMIVGNAANTQKDWQQLVTEGKKFGMTEGKELYDATQEIAILAIQGPKAMDLVQELCTKPIKETPYYTFIKTEIAGIKDAILSINGYTGSGGCEIYVANEDAVKLWKALWTAGEKYGLQNIGLGARDTLRLEMGFMLYGNDIDDNTSPIEAGLGWITKFVDGKKFIDRALFEKQKAEGTERKLIAFELIERGIPRQGYDITDAEGNKIGVVTSGTMSPVSKKGIGMGYVKTNMSKIGTQILIEIRNRTIAAEIVRPPFVKP